MDPLNVIISYLREKDELQIAENLLDVFRKDSHSLDQYDILGKMYHDIKAYHKAIEITETALTVCCSNYQYYSVRCNLIKLYNHTNEPKKALRLIKANNSVNPDSIEMEMESAFSLYLLTRFSEAETLLRKLLERDGLTEKQRDKILFNLGSYDLARGDFKKGLSGFVKIGHKIGIWKKRDLPNEWDGKETGVTVAILENFGIGDSLVTVRFMKHLQELGVTPIWVTSRKDLHSMYNRNGFKCVQSLQEVRNIDPNFKYIEAMMIPVILDIEKESLGREPYITPDPMKVAEWTGRLNLPKDKINIGIRWKGNTAYEHDLHRSFDVSALIKSIPEDFNIISLQRDDGAEDLRHSNVISNRPGIIELGYLGSDMKTLEDTLAIISLLDIVVTSCTSIAHLAAVSGKEVIVLPPISTYYTWLGRTDNKSDWYGDHVTVYTQDTWKSWDSVMAKVRDHLKNMSQ